MAKIWVTNPAESTNVPFLRGILTRSLTDAGLSFDDAYAVSSEIRSSLGDKESISTAALRSQVTAYLTEHYGQELSQAYNSPDTAPYVLRVRGLDGRWAPFSRPQHLRCLESCGLSEEQAAESTTEILKALQEQDVAEIAASDLGRLTYHYLQTNFGKKVAHRYMVWIDHLHSGRPLILLIGGTTGSGKSTIATEVAHRLGIVRTQSTDMLREVMRMMIPKRLLPVLHTSSFNAGDLLPATSANVDDYESQLADGYLTQSELLAVTCEAVVQRALRERVSLILEGVHVYPGLLERIDVDDSAVVVMVTLAILKPEQLKERLSGRLLEAPKRGSSGHLSQFDKVWRMQSFLLSEADRLGITILPNDDKERVTNRIMKTVIDELAKSFTATPEQVFPSVG